MSTLSSFGGTDINKILSTKWMLEKNFTSSGTFTVTKTGIYLIILQGAGGSGAGYNDGATCQGGGAGGTVIKSMKLIEGDSYNITIGAGGNRSKGVGNSGGNSSFGDILIAYGGGGGGINNTVGIGGSGDGGYVIKGADGGESNSKGESMKMALPINVYTDYIKPSIIRQGGTGNGGGGGGASMFADGGIGDYQKSETYKKGSLGSGGGGERSSSYYSGYGGNGICVILRGVEL
ncbi:hypothetical protein NrS5_52 [Nitratiruptor phage NrS-5]|uniref:glycine-rich domain-containing protein n=1 Tax=unclassified Nitratiruptor TaxID=2624044 RepID=UPI001916A0BF|nr:MULTISPECIES: hypothetical protein [unclassified Nitratiruptor]BCD61756.1 hypothetical protein NitYY0813_C0616 [Nitratiruptor sp. YY08-13]BCD65691.1 hypothetical protein NitYY0826_C0618 [Nitratiruptor sp. YY08-26]BCD83234.1 hypothetical protein NrS4_52 [Nitratiruptor phage NrS-4]BCD83293.1 hypothetical protein NrS5_52 [Nitratiruptor phage NrS-5]